MTYGELVRLYFERSNALQWYWTLYVVIIGGLLAFASMRKQPDLVTTILVSVLFVLFAHKNSGAIGDVTTQRQAILDTIGQLIETGAASQADIRASRAIDPTLINPDFKSVRTFHIICDILTVAALWAMELRRRRSVKADGAPAAAP